MQQKQDIKGFTILELLVVITIVAIVSAVGYPNFMEWSEDRKVRKASEQIASMLTNINTQPVSYTHLTLPTNREV